MLKGLEMNGLRAPAAAKSSTNAPVRKSVLVSTRAPASKHHQAFKPVQRPVVRVNAAEAEAAPSGRKQKQPLNKIDVGSEYEGRVVKVEQFGAFVDFGFAKDGLVHISQLSDKFIKSASSVVQPNQTVKVRVMSVDAGTGRIALSMKGMAARAEEDDDAAEDVEEEEEEQLAFAEGDEELGGEFEVAVPDGYEFVSATEDPEIRFLMEVDDEELTLESVAAFEALAPEQVDRQIVLEVMQVPVGEFVTGKVSRVEDYGVFVEFQYNGKTYNALLGSDEAKVPTASLSAEQLAELSEDGEVPAYVDADVDNITSFYSVGQEVSAIVLEYNDKNQMSLTQFADWEIQLAAAEMGDEGLEALDGEELDTLVEDPLGLLEDDGSDAGASVQAEDGSAESIIRADYAANPGYGRPLLNQDLNMTFPNRPLNRVNLAALNKLGFKDTDFDGDEITLDDYWQESFQVPKHALRKLGLRIKINETTGEPEVVEKEGAVAGSFDLESFGKSSHNARVASFVKDLLADDEDEAELPPRAFRAPVVLAAAVQNIPAAAVKDLRNKTGAGMMDCKKALAENDLNVDKAIEWLRKKGLAGADKKAGRVAAEGVVARYIHPGSRLGVLLEVNCETDFVAASDKFQGLVGELGMIIASCPDVICVSPDDVPAEVLAKEREVEMGKEDLKSKPEAVRSKIVEGRIQKIKDNMALVNQDSLRDPNKKVSEIIKESIAAIGENIQVRRFVRFNLGEGLEKRSNDFAAEVAQQTQAKAAAPAAPKKEEPKKEEPKKETKAIQIPASVVKELRDKTGAGMMDCKKALAENDLNIDASIEWLRKKGLAGADKKAGRLAAEGAIAAYIHPGSRLGVLLEVNCETDFVAASDKFNSLVQSIAMQIAASPTVGYVTAEDIPPEVYAREKEIEMGREDLKNKPDAIRAKIAEGRVAKLAQEMALLPQPYLMDPSKTVEQAVKEAVAAIGEKISVRRFVKFQLGEGIEKKVSNLAEEVAAATGKTA